MENPKPSEQEIEYALDRAATSDELVSSPALQKILRYIVTEEIEGRGDKLKAYTIGIDALDKPDSFDPQTDPSVRVNIGRLRQSLELFYLGDGSTEPVKIDIPKGKYKPSFIKLSSSQPARTKTHAVTTSSASPVLKYGALVSFFAVLLIGLSFFKDDGGKFGTGQASQSAIRVAAFDSSKVTLNPTRSRKLQNHIQNLRVAFSRNEALEIVMPVADEETIEDLDFKVLMRLQDNWPNERLVVELLNAKTDIVVWARAFGLNSSEGGVINAVVKELYSQIFGESFRSLEGRDPKKLTARQLFVLATWVPGPAKSNLSWEQERVELARMAIAKDENYGPAHSVLADKLSYLAAIDGPSNATIDKEEAAKSRLRVLDLAPSDENAMFNVAQSFWHSGNLKSAIRTMNRVGEIDPNHTIAKFFSLVIPYSCLEAPHEVVEAAYNFDKSLAPDNPVRWVTLTWIGWLHLNREEYDLALQVEEQSAQIFQIPYTIMRRAVILNQLGRGKEAKELLLQQRRNWPNLSPVHFADVTMPRICKEYSQPIKMLGFYKKLANDVVLEK